RFDGAPVLVDGEAARPALEAPQQDGHRVDAPLPVGIVVLARHDLARRAAAHVVMAALDHSRMLSRRTMAWMPLLPSTSCVTCRSQARLQKTYASERVQPCIATSQSSMARNACFAAS